MLYLSPLVMRLESTCWFSVPTLQLQLPYHESLQNNFDEESWHRRVRLTCSFRVVNLTYERSEVLISFRDLQAKDL
jgi:hypothetical protein